MTLEFDPISSPGATRDLFVDLTGALESEETLMQANVTSAHPATLAISNVAINNEAIEMGQSSVQAAKGVHFTIESLQPSNARVPLTVSFEGDAGTADKYEICQPIVAALCD